MAAMTRGAPPERLTNSLACLGRAAANNNNIQKSIHAFVDMAVVGVIVCVALRSIQPLCTRSQDGLPAAPKDEFSSYFRWTVFSKTAPASSTLGPIRARSVTYMRSTGYP